LEIRIDNIEKNKEKSKNSKNNNNVKRTPSAYILYSKDIRHKISEDVKNNENNNNLNGKEISNLIMKKIGESWSNADSKEKHKYEIKAKNLKTESIKD
jgi:HMG-box domain